jgi:teichuronic acid biosynthesis glycosyltransferase TuaG
LSKYRPIRFIRVLSSVGDIDYGYHSVSLNQHGLTLYSQDHPARTVDISVVIPAYQAEGTLGRAIDSVLAQTVLPREIIVVDDGSSDRTAAIAEEYVSASESCPVKLLIQENLGAGAARNLALISATQPFVAFLDADDEWLPGKLGRSIEVLNTENVDLVSHDYVRFEGQRSEYISCARHFSRRTDPLVDYFLRGYISTSTVVARRSVLLNAGGFDPSLRSGQDYELWLTVIGDPATRHHVFPEALTHYHVMPNSITSQVGLRHAAAVRILYRHLPALRGRGKRPRFTGVLRATIICVQASRAHRSAGNYAGALVAIFRIPIHGISVLLARMDGPIERPNFIPTDEATE